MLLGSVLVSLLAPLLVPPTLLGDPSATSAPVIVGSHWRPLDDPDAIVLPEALRLLPGTREHVLDSFTLPRYLLVRSLPEAEMVIDGFMADEESMAIHGEFIPVADQPVDWYEEGDEAALSFDCEWTKESVAGKVAALYVPLEDGSVLAAWLVTGEEVAFDALREDLVSTVKGILSPGASHSTERYEGIVLEHEVGFALGMSVEEGDIRLAPAKEASESDRLFIEAVKLANPEFNTAIVQNWRDEERGVSLSYQVIGADANLGGEQPFITWLGGTFQLTLRGDPETGDVPVEWIHEAGAHTRVVSEEEVQRHYANNKKAPDLGVILEVYLPKSPFARSCQLRWAEKASEEDETVEYRMVRYVELREYRRSRSETITRIHVLGFLVRAQSEADLDAVAAQLDLVTKPLSNESTYAGPN